MTLKVLSGHALPEHVRAMVNQITHDMRVVVADWYEEQGDFETAKAVRDGGYEAFAALFVPLVPAKDRLFIEGRLVFEHCSIETSTHSTGGEAVYTASRGFAGVSQGRTLTRVFALGRPIAEVPNDMPGGFGFMRDGKFTSIRTETWKVEHTVDRLVRILAVGEITAEGWR